MMRYGRLLASPSLQRVAAEAESLLKLRIEV
jgi:hypothetical protein